MRIAVVVGVITATPRFEAIPGGRFVYCRVCTQADLRSGNATAASGDWLVAFDHLGAGVGQRVSLSEGGEATTPFQPAKVPIDTYVSAMLDHVELA